MSEPTVTDTLPVVEALRHLRRDMDRGVAVHLAETMGARENACAAASRIDRLCERIPSGRADPAELSMTAMFPRLPVSPTCCFSPGYAPADGPQAIVLPFDDAHSGFVPTALCAPDPAAAEALCVLLNGPPGIDGAQRSVMTTRSMRARPPARPRHRHPAGPARSAASLTPPQPAMALPSLPRRKTDAGIRIIRQLDRELKSPNATPLGTYTAALPGRIHP